MKSSAVTDSATGQPAPALPVGNAGKIALLKFTRAREKHGTPTTSAAHSDSESRQR
jgi:hypothetical protein